MTTPPPDPATHFADIMNAAVTPPPGPTTPPIAGSPAVAPAAEQAPAAAPAEPVQPAEPAAAALAEAAKPESAAAPPPPAEEDEFKLPPDEEEPPKSEAQAPPAQPAAAEPKPEETETFWRDLFRGIPDADSERLRHAFLSTNRGKRALEAWKDLRELEKPPADGGIGHAPNAQEIRDLHQRASDFEALVSDLTSDSPDQVKQALKHLFSAQEGQPGAASPVLAEVLPEVLQSSNPRALVTLSATLLGRYVDALYDRASREPSEEKRAYMINTARGVEYDLYGTYRSDDKLPKPAAADPATARQTDIERRERDVTERERRQTQSVQSAFEARVTDAITSQSLKWLDAALQPIQVGFSPRAYEAYRAGILEDLRAATGRDLAGRRRFDSLYDAAFRSGDPADFKVLLQAYRQMAEPVITARRGSWLRDAAVSAKATADSALAASRQASQKVGANGAGEPVRQSVIPQVTAPPKPGQNYRDYAEDALATIMNTGGAARK